jgi:uncharacterized repeat protein (TIGR01451 family)
MKKLLQYFLIGFVWVLMAPPADLYAQISSNTVKYKVTYDNNTQLYTAWVVPDYSVPNSFNNGTTEKGGTAQFTLVVPKDFVITEINDVRGIWAKPADSGFSKFGPGNAGQTWPAGLNQSLNYYVIGKLATQTDYGTFVANTPVAMFTFKGNSCFGPIAPLAPGDPFIAAADVSYSLNASNSFYSLSGQTNGGNVKPIEQFVNVTGPAATCPSAPQGPVDLMVTKDLQGNKVRTMGETLTYRMVVRNLSANQATNIVIKDSLGTGLTLITGVPTTGTFSNPLWSIPTLAAGDSAVLTVTAQVMAQGISYNYAIIKQADQSDNNLTNNKAVACVTIPILLCPGQIGEATVPQAYSNVVWFLNGQQVGTGNVIQISQTGSYTFTASNNTCPANGCCPLIVEADGNCCPPQLCVPVQIKIIKRVP